MGRGKDTIREVGENGNGCEDVEEEYKKRFVGVIETVCGSD